MKSVDAANPAAAWGNLVVETPWGAVRGAADEEGSLAWKGIPYAAPPIGDLRFRAPRPPEPWEGVREAKRFGGKPLQYAPLGGGLVGSEDCLYLNVWRPGDDRRGLPVYVWIHGGGNTMGSADMVPDYYGYAVAARSGMVFVSINYRLGPFGWFLHPALAVGAEGGDAAEGGNSAEADPAYAQSDASGNYGTLDIIRALEWVRDSIAAFGGDPENVTVAGESAGGMNILSLIISERAKGLFQRAVVESGGERIVGRAAAEKAAIDLADKIVKAKAKAAEKPVDAELLRNLPALKFMAALKPGPTGMSGWPGIYADGYVLPADGYASLERGDYPNKVPLVIGTNKEETKLFLMFAGNPAPGSALYAAAARFGSERWKADGVDAIARKMSAASGQPPIYAYRFDWGSPDDKGASELPAGWGKILGSFHTLEVSFFLGTKTINGAFMTGLLFTSVNAKGREALSGLVMGYLASFARSGDPNGEGLARWDPWSNDEGGAKTLVLDARKGQASATMGFSETTRASIEAEMDAALKPALRKATAAFLDKGEKK